MPGLKYTRAKDGSKVANKNKAKAAPKKKKVAPKKKAASKKKKDA